MDIFPDWLGQTGSDVVGIAGHRTVTGPVLDIQGQPLASGTLKVTMLYPQVDGTAFVAPDSMTAEIVNGEVQIPLVAPARYDFLVIDPYEDTLWNFQAFISDENYSAISLAELYLSQEETCGEIMPTCPWTFTGLLDTPNSLDTSAGKLLVVDEDEDGVQVSSKMLWGTGDPEDVVVADIGTIFIREDGGPGSTMYLKESGSGTSAGWAAK